RSCFPLETFSRSLSLKCLRQDLYCNVAMQAAVSSAIHFAHPALSERGKNLVRAEFIPCGYRHLDPSLSRRASLYLYKSQMSFNRLVQEAFDRSCSVDRLLHQNLAKGSSGVGSAFLERRLHRIPGEAGELAT